MEGEASEPKAGEGSEGADRSSSSVVKVERSASSQPNDGSAGAQGSAAASAAGAGEGGEEGDAEEIERLKKGLNKDALRIAQLLSVSPDVVNVSVNVGFNTKVAVDEIMSQRSENAALRQENRRLLARMGQDPDANLETQTPLQALQQMNAKELVHLVQSTEARVLELELENARTRLQMTFMPERIHTGGHGNKPWVD